MIRSHTLQGLTLLALALLVAVVLQACDLDALQDEDEGEDRDVEGINLLEPAGTNVHDDFAAVAEQVPDFGGFFFDEEGHPTVYLQESSSGREDEIRSALESAFGEDVLDRGSSERRTVEDPQLNFQEGEYAMPDLLAWFDELHEVFSVDQVVFIDLHERGNELTVAVDDSSGFEEVEAVLEELETPRAAVDLTLTEPLEQQSHTLRSTVSPPRGGIETASTGRCTFGFISYMENDWGFLTNSHCTDQHGAVTGTTFDQPSGGSQIGVEVEDPDFWSCGFLGLRSCRYSDAAFVEYDDGIDLATDGSATVIARPTDWTNPDQATAGPLTIDHASSTLAITNTEEYPIGGEMLDKIGRTTGWTYGFVNRTCTTGRPTTDGDRVEVNGDKVLYICQDRATYHSNGGDSGSPVFKWHGDTVTAYGIHWGGNSSGAIFSAIWNIREDFTLN